MQPSIEQILSSYDDRAPLSQASTIPAAWYVDPRIAELERLSVFSKTWQLVARADQAENAGSNSFAPPSPESPSLSSAATTAFCAPFTMFAATTLPPS